MSSNERRSRALFVRADGGPMVFSLVPCSERKEIRELIEYGGGVLVQPGKLPDVIRLVPSSVTVTDSSDDVFSANYIRACSKNDKLFRLADFKIPTAAAVVDASDSETRKLRFVRARREYTLGEEIAIAKYVARQPGVRVRGNALYKEMASAGVVPVKRSWQSLKEHYLKKIFPLRHLYESPNAAGFLSRIQRGEEAADPSSSPLRSGASDVLVEDSSSEQDSRTPQKPSESALQDEKTPTDVVPETECSAPSQSSETSVVSACFDTSKMTRKLSFSASLPAENPETTLRESSNTAMESPVPNKKVDRDHSTSTSDQGSTAMKLRKHTLQTRLEVLRKKQEEPSTSSASVRAGSRPGLRKASTGRVDALDTAGQEPILSEQRKLLSSLRRCKNITPQKLPTAHHRMKSGSQCPNIGCAAAVSKDLYVSDATDRQQAPVKLQPQTPMILNSATWQKYSGSHFGEQQLPQSSDSSSLENMVKHSSPASVRRMSLRTLRKRQNTASEELTYSHSKSSGGVGVTPEVKKNSFSPGRCHGNGNSAVEVLLECTPPLSRQRFTRSSPRKRHRGGPQKDSSSHSSTCLCCESTDGMIPETDPEDKLVPFHAGRNLLSCALPADRCIKRGASLRSEQTPDSVSSGKYELADPSPKSNTLPRRQHKTREGHEEVSRQNMGPSSTSIYDTASSSVPPKPGASSGKGMRRQSKLRKPQRELSLSAPAAKTATKRKKEPQSSLICQTSSKSSLPPQCRKNGHAGSAWQGAGTENDNEPLLLVIGAEVEDLDSADEALLTQALVQEAAWRCFSLAPEAAEDHPVVATKETQRDDVSEAGSLTSIVSITSTVTLQDSWHSADEDCAPGSKQGEVSKVQRKLVQLLQILTAGKSMRPHKTCPADCVCPRSAQYIRTARAAVSCSAFLAYHGGNLPSEYPGIEDPEVALPLELLLRRLEGRDENEQDSSDSA